MSANGPILIIDDDQDDQLLIAEIFADLQTANELLIFDSCPAAMHYLLHTPQKPFFILCDINLPQQNGMDFKTELDQHPALRKKSIPFIFYSTAANQQGVDHAYTQLNIQGFFKKADTYDEAKAIIKTIIQYWSYCRHPDT